VIGNSAYQHTRALPNPRNDAEAIARLLGDNGFAKVALKLDLDYRAMRDAVRRFTDAALAADVALVYYAGHGLEVAGENYLVPVDAKLLRDVDLEYEAVSLGSLLAAVDGARRLKLVVLDACRNNPLGEKMTLRAGRMRSATRGLGRLEATGEVLVAYAARAGTLAQDGAGRHSPYAEALLKHMATPGLDVLRMFGRVKEAVLAATNQGQEPWIYGSPGGEAIALVPAKGGAGDGKSVLLAPSALSEVERAWAALKDGTNVAVLEAFRRQYGPSNALYDRPAEMRINELNAQQLAALKADAERKRTEAIRQPGRQVPNKLPYGSRAGMDVSVKSFKGLGTRNASIKIEHTRADANAYCVNYLLKRNNDEACIAEGLRLAFPNDVRADCVDGTFTVITHPS
jgi:hypothetical protein